MAGVTRMFAMPRPAVADVDTTNRRTRLSVVSSFTPATSSGTRWQCVFQKIAV